MPNQGHACAVVYTRAGLNMNLPHELTMTSEAPPTAAAFATGTSSPQRQALEAILGALDTLVFVMDDERAGHKSSTWEFDIFSRLEGAGVPPPPILKGRITSEDVLFGKYEVRLFDPNAGEWREVMQLSQAGHYELLSKNIGTRVTCGGDSELIGYATEHFSCTGGTHVFRHTKDETTNDPEKLTLKIDATPMCGYICCAFLCFIPTFSLGSCVAFCMLAKHELKGSFKDAEGTTLGTAVLKSSKKPHGAIVLDVGGWNVARKIDVLATGIALLASNNVRRQTSHTSV